jgi:hypothetical protein
VPRANARARLAQQDALCGRAGQEPRRPPAGRAPERRCGLSQARDRRLDREKFVQPDSIVVSDGLACSSGIATAGVEHQPVVTGGGAASVELEDFRWLNTVLGNVKNALHGTYHKLSAQHLPRYLADFCYRFNRRFGLAAMLPRLGYAAAHTPPMPYRLLKLAEAHW